MKRAYTAALVAAAAWRAAAQGMEDFSFVTEYYDDCETTTEAMPEAVVTDTVTYTSCSNDACTHAGIIKPAAGHTTTYTTVYQNFGSTGLEDFTYTVTAMCSDASMTSMMMPTGPGGLPPGFAVTVDTCTVCGPTPITATLTVCTACPHNTGAPAAPNAGGANAGGANAVASAAASAYASAGAGAGSGNAVASAAAEAYAAAIAGGAGAEVSAAASAYASAMASAGADSGSDASASAGTGAEAGAGAGSGSGPGSGSGSGSDPGSDSDSGPGSGPGSSPGSGSGSGSDASASAGAGAEASAGAGPGTDATASAQAGDAGSAPGITTETSTMAFTSVGSPSPNVPNMNGAPAMNGTSYSPAATPSVMPFTGDGSTIGLSLAGCFVAGVVGVALYL